MPEVGRPRGTIDTDLHLPPVSPITGKDHSPGRAPVPIPEPVRPNVPIVPVQPVSMEPVHEYPERHVHPVTYVHPEQVVMPEVAEYTPPPRLGAAETLTTGQEKELTTVKGKTPEE